MEAESLSAACELAFSVARDGVEATPSVDPPTPMRSFLYVAQLPKRAMTVAQRVIDEDPEFRAHVAQAATPESVGEIGYLWLTRPDGWQGSIEALDVSADHEAVDTPAESTEDEPAEATDEGDTAAPPVPPPPPPPPSFLQSTAGAGDVAESDADEETRRTTSSDAIREELSSLQGLVSRLSEERRQVSSNLETVETSTDGGISAQIQALRQDLIDIRAERDRAQEQKELSIVRQAELADEISDLRRLLSSLEEERAGIQATLAQAEEQVAGVQVVVTALEGQRDNLRNQTEALGSERDALRAEVEELSEQRAALASERDNLLGERDDLTGQLAQAGSNAQILEAQINDISSQAASLQSDFETLARERAAVGAELERLNTDVADRSASRRTMVEALSGQFAELKSEREVLARNLEESQNGLANLRGAFAKATELINTELDRVDSNTSEVKSTEASLTAALESTDTHLNALMSAEEPTPPNMGVLDSELGSDAGQITFVADIPPAPVSSNVAAGNGPAYEAPPAPQLGESVDGDASNDVEGSVEDDELDAVGDEIAAELAHTDGDDQNDTPASGSEAAGRRAIEIPDSLEVGSEALARHVVNTPDVVVLIQGDAVASMGWPSMTVQEQRSALVTYLNILAGDTGAAPDVMFDSAISGADALPESRVVRIRISDDSGSDVEQLSALIDTYPEEWPVALVTDDEVLSAMASRSGATVLNNGQLLDLFD